MEPISTLVCSMIHLIHPYIYESRKERPFPGEFEKRLWNQQPDRGRRHAYNQHTGKLSYVTNGRSKLFDDKIVKKL